jgi:outer membrane lipoprotein SlyB
MLTNNRRKLAVMVVGLSALALGGCASNDSVAKAQSTADQALAQAQQAQQQAQLATQQAQQAQAASDRSFQNNLRK